MERLVAHFDVEMPGQPLIACVDKEPVTFQCKVNGFRIEIQLMPSGTGKQGKGESHWTRVARHALVRVSHPESELPPEVLPDALGQLDYTIQYDYFKKREKTFGAAGREAINRLIRIFKYSLRTPFMEEIRDWHASFKNAKWTDENNQIIGKAGGTFVSEPVPGFWGELGVDKITAQNKDELQLLLNNPVIPPLFEEFLADAQTALFSSNLRRALIELAVGCEIMVKRHFFAQNTPAGAAIDWLEDKRKANVGLVDLIGPISAEAYGRSFMDDHPDEYRDIDNLASCRNKVVHRGELWYRISKGKSVGQKVYVDRTIIETWWNSVLTLNRWLQKLQPSSP